MNQPCGCCAGTERLTPVPLNNRPGLHALVYRVGTHATFLETMLARLGTLYWKIPPQEIQSWQFQGSDVLDRIAFATTLRDAVDPVSQFLRDSLSAKTRDLLAAYAGCSSPSHALLEALLTGLNSQLQNPALYDQDRFAQVALSDEVRELARAIQQAILLGNDRFRLNRLLLEAAYRGELRRIEWFYPLRNLTTRALTDPAIALLDAWATVADVLTFYQERIANEGYLRTATERRSILELARLVGYRLRPGVASSVYLAFTLEKDHDVEIPPGTRAQSLPGPGELPQSFETSDKLEARAGWNTLGPRLTQPTYIVKEKIEKRNSPFDLYFKGVATHLKPGDPLLFVFNPHKVFAHITAVEPQEAQKRTKVRLQVPVRKAIALRSPLEAFHQAADAILGIAARYQNLDKFAVSPTTGTARRITSFLKREGEKARELKAEVDKLGELESGKLEPILGRLAGGLKEHVMPFVDEEHEIAVKGKYTHLERWLGAMKDELRSEADRLEAFLAERSQAALDAAALAKKEEAARLATFGSLLEPLRKSPLPQLATPLDLGRTVGQTYALEPAAQEGGVDRLPDIGAQLAVTFNPLLRNALYPALANAEVTQASSLKSANALRVKAAPFGHNAPLKPILNEKGIVIGHEEWPLAGTVGIRLDFFTQGAERATIAIAEHDRVETSTISAIAKNNIFSNGWTLDVDEKQNYVFKDPEGNTKTIFAAPVLDQGALRVKINARSEHSVGPQQVVRHSIEGQDITISNQEQAAFILDESPLALTERQQRVLALDAQYDQITPGSWVALELGSRKDLVILPVAGVRTVSKAAYGITGTVTELTFDNPWAGDDWFKSHHYKLSALREVTVYAQSEPLELAEEPIDADVKGESIELDGLYPALKSGRWVIVSGERTDILGTSGVRASELLMLAKSTQGVRQVPASPQMIDLPGDKTHTTIELAQQGMAYRYKRDTVTVYGNVTKATHGETRNEVLGSGDAGKTLQQFSLRQSPLTYLPSPTPSGAESTLEVRVNDILWHEAASLAGLSPTDRKYITHTDNADKTSAIFGNGRYGARVPTGVENVKAHYRTGIGKPGNVNARQISLLATKPLGVKAVINPLPATGGADRDTRDQARHNTPLAVMALDRLVSVQDYADFARTFAGIGKASASRLPDGQRQLVEVTVAGKDDIPVDKNSDLYRGLTRALHDFGDPSEPVRVDLRQLFLLVLSGKVRVLPDYQWESVEPQIRSALLDAFGFERRELAQDVLLSEVVSTIQRIEGVAYVDVDVLYPIPESVATVPGRLQDTLLELAKEPMPPARKRMYPARFENGALLPAQIAYLTPAVPDTLILAELTK